MVTSKKFFSFPITYDRLTTVIFGTIVVSHKRHIMKIKNIKTGTVHYLKPYACHSPICGIYIPSIYAISEKNEKVTCKKCLRAPYSIKERLWKRMNRIVKIKRFRHEKFNSILKKKQIHTKMGFYNYLISECVLDYKRLYSYVDITGISKKIAPPILMYEIYKLCFLDDIKTYRPECYNSFASFIQTTCSTTDVVKENYKVKSNLDKLNLSWLRFFIIFHSSLTADGDCGQHKKGR